MGIKGMTDQQEALPIIGILRKGEAKKGNKPGQDLTYFRWVSDDPDATALFKQAYPNEEALRNINVLLPYKTTDDNFDSWIEKWVAGGLIYRSDGETIVLWRTPNGNFSTEEKPDPKPAIKEDGKREDGSCCVGRLSVIIPELGRLVTVTILTTSKNDIIKITKQLRMIETMRGDLRGIPFVVRRRPEKISTPGENGKRVRREKWLLAIETQPEYTRLQLKAMQQAALPATVDIEIEADEVQEKELSALPANAIDPFEYDGQPEEPTPQPTRQPLTPKKLLNGFDAAIKAKPYIDGDTGEALPISVHALGENAAKLVAAKWAEALGGDIDAYHLSLMASFGQNSAKDLTAGQGNAALSWLLGSQKWGFDTPVVEPVPEEAKALLAWAKQQNETE